MTRAQVLLFAGVCTLTLWYMAASQDTSPDSTQRCQPHIASQCVDRMETLVEYVNLYNRKHTSQTPITSWGALCGASYETTLCITKSTKGCDSKAIWLRFFGLIQPLDSFCTKSSGATCNVTAGTVGFTELVEANIKRILNPYLYNSDFCWYRLKLVDSAIKQSIPSCTPYFNSHLAELIRIFQDPVDLMCDTARIKCEFGTPLKNGQFYKICDNDADCASDNYRCINQSLHRTAICCLKYETSESCDMTAIHNCFTKFTVRAIIELTSVIPKHFEICSELNKTRSCVVKASVDCTDQVRSGLTALANTLQKHLDKAVCVDTCSGAPCHNEGTCLARFGWYICVCTSNFTGDNCEIDDMITSTPPSAKYTSITNTITDTAPYSTTAYMASSRQVVLVIRLAMNWRDSYENRDNKETQELVTALEKALSGIYGSINEFRHVQVQRLFESSVGVEHLVEFDHGLSDADRTTIGLALTSALDARNNTLTFGNQTTGISGKTEMIVAGEKVEVNDACFLYNQKHVCQNGGTCVASQTSASCICASGYVGVYCGATKRKSNNTVGITVGIIIAVLSIVAIVIGVLVLCRRRQHRPGKMQATPSQDDNKDARHSETEMTDNHIYIELSNTKDDATDADAGARAETVVSETPNHSN